MLRYRSHAQNQRHHVKKFNLLQSLDVIGVQGGLSSSLLGHEKDLSFRQCIGATPIICKKKNVFHKKGNNKYKGQYENVTYAFQIDYSNDAMYAFETMVDHFENGDTIHLIWVKPDTEASNFQNQGIEAINFVFQPYKRILQDLKLVESIHTIHLFFYLQLTSL